MTGLEILAIEEVVTRYEMSLLTKATMIAIISIAVIAGSYWWYKSHDFGDFVLSIVIGVVVSLFLGGMVDGHTQKPVEYETRYKVLISDEVNFNEFNDKYDVLNQEGKIFVIRDKKVEETE